MQPLIHKASVHLTTKSLPSSVAPGDAVDLRLQDEGTIIAILALSSRLPFGLGQPRKLLAGHLGQKASELLTPALERKAHLRVRVVEVEPAHLSRTGQSYLYISVWGSPQDLLSQTPRYSIFSSSRIHEAPSAGDKN